MSETTLIYYYLPSKVKQKAKACILGLSIISKKISYIIVNLFITNPLKITYLFQTWQKSMVRFLTDDQPIPIFFKCCKPFKSRFYDITVVISDWIHFVKLTKIGKKYNIVYNVDVKINAYNLANLATLFGYYVATWSTIPTLIISLYHSKCWIFKIYLYLVFRMYLKLEATMTKQAQY